MDISKLFDSKSNDAEGKPPVQEEQQLDQNQQKYPPESVEGSAFDVD